MDLRCAALALLVLTACASPGATGRSGGAAAAIPVPAACVEPVERSIRVGRQLALHDFLQRWAVDALGPRSFGPLWIVGRVVTHDSRGWVVHLVSRDEHGVIAEPARVAFAAPSRAAAAVTVNTPPAPLDPETALLFAVFEQATARPIPRCAPERFAVVLPGELLGEEDWQVYLLQGGDAEGWQLGGHVLRTVVPDGRYVVEDFLLTPRCHAIRVSSGEARVADRSPCPRELHVYNTLLHGRPMLLDTPEGRWRIEGDRVEFLSAAEGLVKPATGP